MLFLITIESQFSRAKVLLIIVLTDMGRWMGRTKRRREGVLLPLLLLCVLILYKLDMKNNT